MDLLSVKAGMETQHNHLGLILETVLQTLQNNDAKLTNTLTNTYMESEKGKKKVTLWIFFLAFLVNFFRQIPLKGSKPFLFLCKIMRQMHEENSSRVKKGGQTYQHCFPSERRSESEAGPAFSGTSVCLEHHAQTEQVLEEHTEATS